MNRRTRIIYISGGVGLTLIAVVIFLYFFQFQYRTLTDKKLGFSIEYPADWELVRNFHGATAFFKAPLDGPLDIYHENVTVNVQDISANPMRLREYSDTAIDQMEAVFMHNFELHESTSVAILGGYPAYKVIFTGKGPDGDIMVYATWAVLDRKKVYQVSYAAFPSQFEKYYLTVERMLLSFKIF